jgi:hypothetical protein
LFADSPARVLVVRYQRIACVTERRALSDLVISAAGSSLLGALIGWCIGTVAPGYYRAVVRGGEDPSFSPVDFGLGQGATLGVVAGLATGVVLVAFFTWYYDRRRTA